MPLNTPDIAGIKEFKHYREKGLSYRKISLLMQNKKTKKNKPLETLRRWNNYINNGILEKEAYTSVR